MYDLSERLIPADVLAVPPVDVAVARKEGRLWKYSPDPRHMILGQPVGAFQLAMIMFCGIATMLLVLRANHVTMKLAVPKVVNWTSVSVDHHFA